MVPVKINNVKLDIIFINVPNLKSEIILGYNDLYKMKAMLNMNQQFIQFEINNK